MFKCYVEIDLKEDMEGRGLFEMIDDNAEANVVLEETGKMI